MFVISTSGGSGDAGRSLVQFSLPSAPTGCTITSATLRLNAESYQSGRTIAVHRNSGSWAEGSVTWNSMPGYTGTAVTTASAFGWLQWTVTDHVSAMYSGSNNGFLVKDYYEDDSGSNQETQRFTTRETSTDPELVITWG